MLFHNDYHIAEIRERERRLRIEAERHRLFSHGPGRLRLRLGELLIRLGRVIGGDIAKPASTRPHATNAPVR